MINQFQQITIIITFSSIHIKFNSKMYTVGWNEGIIDFVYYGCVYYDCDFVNIQQKPERLKYILVK